MMNQEAFTDNTAVLCITKQDLLPQKSHNATGFKLAFRRLVTTNGSIDQVGFAKRLTIIPFQGHLVLEKSG